MLLFGVLVWIPTESNGRPYTGKRSASAGPGEIVSAKWGNPKGGGRANGELKADAQVL